MYASQKACYEGVKRFLWAPSPIFQAPEIVDQTTLGHIIVNHFGQCERKVPPPKDNDYSLTSLSSKFDEVNDLSQRDVKALGRAYMLSRGGCKALFFRIWEVILTIFSFGAYTQNTTRVDQAIAKATHRSMFKHDMTHVLMSNTGKKWQPFVYQLKSKYALKYQSLMTQHGFKLAQLQRSLFDQALRWSGGEDNVEKVRQAISVEDSKAYQTLCNKAGSQEFTEQQEQLIRDFRQELIDYCHKSDEIRIEADNPPSVNPTPIPAY